MTRPSPDEQGFTLIELMISLSLFALIAVAGLAMVDGILGVQGRTEVRLNRLADLQRAVQVFSSDLDQISDGSLAGTSSTIAFGRSAPGLGGAVLPLRYGLVEGALVRSVGGRPQLLLGGVADMRFRYLDAGWQDGWPGDARLWPRAVELQVTLAPGAGPSGSLRRVIVLPERPDPPAAALAP